MCHGCRQRLHSDLSDLLAQVAELNLQPRRGAAQRVGGTRTPPMPVNEDAFNLAGPGTAHVRVRDTDQVGPLPAHVWLGEWSTRWDGITPRAIEAACDQDLDVAAFAAELREQLAAVRAANKDGEQPPDYKHGVPCRKCDMLALSQAGGDDYIACGVCGALYTPAEYDQWCRLLTEPLKQQRQAS